MQESKQEGKLQTAVRKAGGIALKNTGYAGIPDRLLVLPNGKIVWVEMKAPNGRLSKIQKTIIKQLRELGHDVRVVSNMQETEELINEVT